MKTSQTISAIILAASALLSGCANTGSQSSSSASVYGVIDAIETTQGGGDGIGAGAVIGGVVGGVLGHQVGGGTGKDVATAAGVVGGAVAGHQIEKGSRQQEAYRVRVRLENGGYQTVTQQNLDGLRIGDRVRIENNRVMRY